jgi:hypothetical protein
MNYRIKLVGAETYRNRVLTPPAMKKGETRDVSEELKNQLMRNTYIDKAGEVSSYFEATPIKEADVALEESDADSEGEENPAGRRAPARKK